MVTRVLVTPQILNYVLVIIAIVFCHKLTQTSWCCAISASLEVKSSLGAKVLPEPAHPGGVAVSGPLHCHSVSRNFSFTPHLPKANCCFIRKYSLSLEFYCSLMDLSLPQTFAHPLAREHGFWCVLQDHPTEEPARQLPQGTSPQDGCASAVWRCLKVVCVSAGLCSRYNPLPCGSGEEAAFSDHWEIHSATV